MSMIERLKEILVERTVSVQVKCVVDETVIDRNFAVIIECLRHMEQKQSAFQKSMNEIRDKNQLIQKQLEESRSTTLLRDDTVKVQQQEATRVVPGDSSLQDIVNQIREQVRRESELNKKNNLQNIKDINVLLKDVKELKQKIQALEKSNSQAGPSKAGNQNNNAESNLQNIRVVQNELQKHSEKLDKLQSEMDKVKNKTSSIMEKLKGNGQSSTNVQAQTGNEQEENRLEELRKGLQQLLARFEDSENKQRAANRDITIQIQNLNISLQSLQDLQGRVTSNQEDIEDIRQRLEGMSNSSQQNGDPSLQKLRLQKQLKRLEESNRRDLNKGEEWKRKMEQSMKQHQLTIIDIQSHLEELDNLMSSLQKDKDRNVNYSMKDLDQTKKLGDKLPTLSGKKNLKLKSISREDSGQKGGDFDKKLQQLRSEMQQWVKQLLDARGIFNQDSAKKKDQLIDGIDLKMQEVKMMLERKADNEGVKKYLSFLDNKINQIWSIMSQPETEDALIARKGWNCLSCAKKLQKYRGKIGQHINWNNMTTSNYSPPRVGHTLNPSHNTTQNMTVPAPRSRANQTEANNKEFS